MKIAVIVLVVLCLAVANAREVETHHPGKSSHHIIKHSSDDGSSHDVAKVAERSHGTSKHVKKSGKKSGHDEEVAVKGHTDVAHHKVDETEDAGKKKSAHTHAVHEAHVVSASGTQQNANNRDGVKHKKTEVTKGSREQYHKAEHKKHDTTYSNGHKSGTWKSYGNKASKHQTHKVDKDERGKRFVVKSGEQHGKPSKKKSSTHKNEDHRSHKAENGKKSTHDKHEKWSKTSQQKYQDKHKFKYLPATKV